MKKGILFIFLFSSGFLFAQNEQLKNFNELMTAFKEGTAVKAVFKYEKMQLISDNAIEEESVKAIGGMQVDTWEFFEAGAVRNKKAFLVSSESVLIENPLGEGYVYNYVKIKVYDNNEVRIIARYLKAPELIEIMDESFYGSINDGKNEEGVYFYMD